jgi:precorrin-4 methylase
MRQVYNSQAVNVSATIAGIEYKIVIGVTIFFSAAALMEHLPSILLAPAIILWFLHGSSKRDGDFLKVYKRHASQKEIYSPAYITKPNLRTPRPIGFSRMDIK